MPASVSSNPVQRRSRQPCASCPDAEPKIQRRGRCNLCCSACCTEHRRNGHPQGDSSPQASHQIRNRLVYGCHIHRVHAQSISSNPACRLGCARRKRGNCRRSAARMLGSRVGWISAAARCSHRRGAVLAAGALSSCAERVAGSFAGRCTLAAEARGALAEKRHVRGGEIGRLCAALQRPFERIGRSERRASRFLQDFVHR